jgi:glucose-6-phosphate 1-dehydrogenase
MDSHHELEPTVLVIFGCGGDLARRMLVPALVNLFLDGNAPESFALIGVDRHLIVLSLQGFRYFALVCIG